MPMDNTYVELFKNGRDFDQILFLDNFFDKIQLDLISEKELITLLNAAIHESRNHYVKRTAFKILCEVTLAGKIKNQFFTLGILQNFLESEEEEFQIISLKYFPFFPLNRDSSELIETLKYLSDSHNGDVSSQAYFCLGKIELTKEVESDLTRLLVALESAENYFSLAHKTVENRIDAEQFLALTKWAKAILSNNTDQINLLFDDFQNLLLIKNLFEFEGSCLELDFLLFLLTEKINNSANISVKSSEWLNIAEEIQNLARISLELQKIRGEVKSYKSLFDALYNNVYRTLEDQLYQSNLFLEKKRIEKLQGTIDDGYLDEFLARLISLMPDSPEKSPENDKLLGLFIETLGVDAGLERYRAIENKTVSSEVVEEIENVLTKIKGSGSSLKTGSVIGEEVYLRFRNELAQLLPEYPVPKMTAFLLVIEEVIRYARVSFVGNTKRRFPFLFSKASGGKGADAVEQELQDNMLIFFEHSSIADGLDHEKTKFVDGGRVDIIYKKDLITIPIELKKTKDRPNKKEIEKNYIAQAQTYTAGYDQLGIFVLLELSDKSSEPPPNFKDWFHLHHLSPSSNMPINHPDYILSVVIPGNRTSPSTKSTYK